MIKIPKKQSFNPQHLLVALLLLPLIASFVYAAHYQVPSFVFLILSLVFSVGLLVFFRSRLILKKAELELQRQEYFEKANLLEAEMACEWVAIESCHKKISDYSQLKDVTERLCLCFTVDDTSRALSSEVGKLFGHHDLTVMIYLFHSRTGDLGLSASQKGQMRVNIKDKRGDIYDQWVVKTMKPLLVEDARSDFRFDADRFVSEDERQIRSLMCVPMTIGNKAIGLLRLDSPQENHFAAEDMRLLMTISDLGAIAIENAQLYEKLEDLAVHDSLTGLYLHRYFMKELSPKITRELRRKEKMSFLMIDIDKFKYYNDRFGHTAGDIVLRTMGLLLKEMFRKPGNMVCRYGGEEFAVLLPDCSKAQAGKLAEELRKKVEGQSIILRRQKTHVTVSIGVAGVPEDAMIKEDLIQKADEALYRAKETGRNRVCIAE